MLFGQTQMYPENNSSGRECCRPYLIGQHPLSPVFGQKRPGAPGNRYFAQLPPVLVILCSFPVGYSTTRIDQHGPQEQLTAKFRPGDVEIDKIFSFSVNNFGSNQLYYYTSLNHNKNL